MALPMAIERALSIRSSAKRKTIGLRVADGQLLVTKPSRVGRAEVMELLAEKSQWILQKLAQQQARAEQVPQYHYDSGELLPWLGEDLLLQVVDGSRNSVERRGDELWVELSRRGTKPRLKRVRELVQQWYQQQALLHLSERSQQMAAQIGHSVAAVKVKYTRSKWGHCTSGGELQYNWLILLAPAPVVDYLVAHEVSHLQHLNHSPAFWAQVAELCSDFKNLRNWLKHHGHTLVL